MHRILLVEDEKSIRDVVKLNLELAGFEVVCAIDGEQALSKFNSQYFDLILLDLMLPKIDGMDLCETFRLTDGEIPVIMLTAKDASEDIVMGLKKGADDYLTKPFLFEELLLRIQNLLRRTRRDVQEWMSEYVFGENRVNFKTLTAVGKSGQIRLTKKEAMLLKLLISRRGEVVSRQTILKNVWGYDVYPSTRTVDNFIMAFRKYFEQDAKNPRHFHSVRGIGYRFTD